MMGMMGPYGSENSKMPLLLQIRSQKFSKLFWIFLPMILTKLRLEFLKFWFSDFNDFISKISNSPL